MKKLIAGVHAFHAQLGRGGSFAYEPLSDSQTPDTLFVACSDSRVVPAFLSSSEPGDLFTIRNVGNLIPRADPEGASMSDHSEGSAIEYALRKLGVRDVVICGHSGCGAITAIAAGDAPDTPKNLERWLEQARGALDASAFPAKLGDGFTRLDTLSQRNVVLQLRALDTYPDVLAGRTRGLRVHGWWFDIRRPAVLAYDPVAGQFVAFEQVYGTPSL